MVTTTSLTFHFVVVVVVETLDIFSRFVCPFVPVTIDCLLAIDFTGGSFVVAVVMSLL